MSTLYDRVFGHEASFLSEGKPTNPKLDATYLTDGLWIGSHPECGRLVGYRGFDLLVLCAEEYQPAGWEFPGVEVHHAPFDDSHRYTTAERFIVERAAKKVAEALSKRQKVLVTCWAGHNRSGLVCGKALTLLGWDPVKAIHLIQGKRKRALSNETFVDAICET